MENEQDNNNSSNSSSSSGQPENTGRDLPARNPDIAIKSDTDLKYPDRIQQRDEQ